MKVVGVVGPLSSGKGTVLDKLEERGFKIYSLSTTLRELAEQVKMTPTREALQDLGDILRKHDGPGRLAELTIDKILADGQRFVGIDSIRNPGEIEVLRRQLKAYIVGVDAPIEKRFEWIRERKRFGDPQTWDDFMRLGERDLGVGQENYGQQVQKCLEMADTVIVNDGSFHDLELKVENWLKEIGIEGQRSTKEKRA